MEGVFTAGPVSDLDLFMSSVFRRQQRSASGHGEEQEPPRCHQGSQKTQGQGEAVGTDLLRRMEGLHLHHHVRC